MAVNNKQIRQDRIDSILDKIIRVFESGQVPQVIAKVTFPPFEVPSKHWSLANRLIMFGNGTSDARGFLSWQAVGRYVKKKTRAFYILAPLKIKRKQKGDQEDDENNEYLLIGFTPIPVFAVEDTEGKQLEYENIVLPDFPLIEVAYSWGISVKGVAFQGRWYGYYSQDLFGNNEKIRLATPEESTFFHELSHAAHKRVKGELQNGQNSQQEITAELSAQVLGCLLGTQVKNNLGNAYSYIKHYAEKIGKSPAMACLSVLADVQKILDLILDSSKFSMINS